MNDSSSSRIEYRWATVEDIDRLIDLRCQMQLEVNKHNSQKVTAEYIKCTQEYFYNSIVDNTYHCSVALSNGMIIGTAGVCLYKKPPSISGGSGLVGYVSNVFVERSFRRKGIAQHLMKQINKLATIYKVDKLHLGASENGYNVYRSVGYVEPKFKNLEIKFTYAT